jgi:hypothetical protein
MKSRNKYRDKWWVKPIRFMNYLAFRYWWFVWSFFIISILLLYIFCCNKSKNKTNKNTQCPEKAVYYKNMKEIDSLMKNCCTCLPDTSGIRPEDKPIEDTTIAEVPEEKKPPIPPPPPPPNSIPCDSEMEWNGANEKHHKTWDLGTKSGNVHFCYDTKSIEDDVTIKYNGRIIHDSGMIGTNGEKCYDFYYKYDPSKPRYLDVFVNPSSNPNTEWYYRIDCPR